jgi:hypothetical protein
MKLFDSIILGSAASAALAGAAQAADLPTHKAAPAEYVRICNAFGAGYFYIPGTDTCLKIGGVVRADYTWRPGAPSNIANQSGYNLAGQVYNRDTIQDRTRVYVTFDSRSNTDYGELRAYTALRWTQDSLPSGPFGGGKIVAPGLPPGVKESAGAFQGFTSGQTYLESAFVQWAGLTAGITHSFIDFYTHNYEMTATSVGVSDQALAVLAYTAKLGSGFSASASIENPKSREIGDSTADIGIANNNPKNAATAAYLTYGAMTIPDVVGNIRYDGAWGSAQLGAAAHEVNSAPIFGCSKAVPATGNCGTAGDTHFLPIGFTPSTKWGFAVEGGAKFKLDAVSPGDSATFQVSYEQGAMDYVNSADYFAGTPSVYSHKVNVPVPNNDAFVLPNGTIGLNHAVGGFAGVQHFWIPTVRSNLFGSYLRIQNPVAAQFLGVGADNARVWNIGFNTVWSPVKQLDIGAEVVYTNLALSGAATLATATVLPNSATKGPITPINSDVRAKMRIQMTF